MKADELARDTVECPAHLFVPGNIAFTVATRIFIGDRVEDVRLVFITVAHKFDARNSVSFALIVTGMVTPTVNHLYVHAVLFSFANNIIVSRYVGVISIVNAGTRFVVTHTPGYVAKAVVAD